jgi:glycosyltransferase involved in cell wall biosynthesis
VRIEALVTCWNYADFLAETLDSVVAFADEVLVVTHPDDKRTISLCEHRGVRCEPTATWARHGATLDKAAAINHGLRHLPMADWVAHLDADIWMPAESRRIVENAELDPAKVYGCSRCNCVGHEAWDEFRAAPWSNGRPPHYIVSPYRGMDVGGHISHPAYGGYVPIGFFQLWNPKASGVAKYPEVQRGDAEHTDVLFAVQGRWSDRMNRVHLAELLAVHLVSGKGGPMGANWHGRKTPPFRPPAGSAGFRERPGYCR